MRPCHKRGFLFFEVLQFVDSRGYHGLVPLKINKIKPVFDHLIGKFSAGYVAEDQLSINRSLLLWKGCLGWKVNPLEPSGNYMNHLL
jgi:hypothetical protein